MNPQSNPQAGRGLSGRPSSERVMVEIKSVAKSFGDVRAVDGIDIHIREGEFFSLLGPSGCGKTTLLRLIAGFEHPDTGAIVIAGSHMENVEPNHRPTNMVFQSYAIFPHLNVEENVAYGLKKRGGLKKQRGLKKQGLGAAELQGRVNEMLGLVDLEGYNKRPAYALSGGQRQRVALARALIMKPKVLLLDEPLSALDKKLREQMQVELRSLQRTVGITFVLVTHDQEEALTMSDRIAVMFDGRIAQLATPQELYRRPRDRRIAAFIGMMNFTEGRLLDAGAEADSGAEVEAGAEADSGAGADAVNAGAEADSGADVLTVDAGLFGRVTIAPDQMPVPLAPGAVTIGIRPEMLTILYDAANRSEIEVEGEIASTSYYGDMTYYGVRIEGIADEVMVSMRNTAGRRVLDIGEKTRIGLGSESLVLLGDGG